MNKEVKSLGLAIVALPFGFAIAGMAESLGWVQSSQAWSWAFLKWVVMITCGLAYFVGLKIFSDGESEVQKGKKNE